MKNSLLKIQHLTSPETQHHCLTADLLAYLTFDTRSIAATGDREAFTLSVRLHWRQMLQKKGCPSGPPKNLNVAYSSKVFRACWSVMCSSFRI